MSGQMSRCIQSNDLQISNLGSAGNLKLCIKLLLLLLLLLLFCLVPRLGVRGGAVG